MATVNVRVDAETTVFLEKFSRETGRTKSDVVRDALLVLREQRAKSAPRPPAESMAHLIGSWDSGGLQLSQRTGQRFAEILKAKSQKRGARRRRPSDRSDRSH